MKKVQSIILCALGALSLIGYSSLNKGEDSKNQEAKIANDSFDNSQNENTELVLSYKDIFREYYNITVSKLEVSNKAIDFTFDDFCNNYYSSNLELSDYVESYVGDSKLSKVDETPHGLLPLRSSSSGDEKYILKGGISDPNGSNFDPYYTPTNAIKRTIKYASSAAYNNLQNGDIVTETSTKFSNMGHSAILYDCNKHASGNLEGRSTYIQTIEAVGDGVQFGFLDDDRMVSFGVVIIRPKNAYSSDVYDALNFCYDQLGKPYYLPLENGTAQTSRYSQHWYCSELVYAAYEDTGVTIAYASSGGWVWPIDILWSTRVDFVCYNKTLDTEYMGKTNGKFKLRVYNRTGSTRTVYYNSKKCFKNDAKGWSNLHDWQNNYVSISNGSYADILISSNWFADCAAISYTYSGKRYITYVQFNALSDSTLRVGIFKNVKNA